jgi:hypothetical protein
LDFRDITPFLRTMIYILKMPRMVLSISVFLLLPAYVLASCSKVCATCVNPFSYPSKTMCTSCYSDYVLLGYSCYSCEKCQYYGICDDCNSSSDVSQSSTPSLYGIIFGTIAAVIVVCVLIIFIYYQYCIRGHRVHESAVHQQSAAELALPSDLKWERSENKINGG